MADIMSGWYSLAATTVGYGGRKSERMPERKEKERECNILFSKIADATSVSFMVQPYQQQWVGVR